MIICEPALFSICADSDPAPIANIQRYSTAKATSVVEKAPNKNKRPPITFIITISQLAHLGFGALGSLRPSSSTAMNRDSPDESQTGINVRVFPALLQDRREVLTATSTTGNPNACSRV